MENKNVDIKALNEKIQKESAFIDMLMLEVNKVIVGQKYMIQRLLIGLLGKGHILLEGVPGLAKTLAINSLSQAVKGSFSRIQFTPDLLPADVVGTMIYNMKENDFSIKKGPIFANFVLADEINRAPAKVQSALLESMQEKQVTIGDNTFKLQLPFLVMATQNPLDQEGTYQLPEAQLDRFIIKTIVEYPNREEELEIINRMGVTESKLHTNKVLTKSDITNSRRVTDLIHVEDTIKDYIVSLVISTRNSDNTKPKIKGMIRCGASPRATINFILASKATAFIQGRSYVVPSDVKKVAHDILRHRILLTYEAEAEQITSDEIIEEILASVPVP